VNQYTSAVSVVLIGINLLIIMLSIVCIEVPITSYDNIVCLIAVLFSSYMTISAIDKLNNIK